MNDLFPGLNQNKNLVKKDNYMTFLVNKILKYEQNQWIFFESFDVFNYTNTVTIMSIKWLINNILSVNQFV